MKRPNSVSSNGRDPTDDNLRWAIEALAGPSLWHLFQLTCRAIGKEPGKEAEIALEIKLQETALEAEGQPRK